MLRHLAKRLYREEDGQALLWGAGVIVLLVALFFGAVDLGQLVLGKIQAQNAADAAAMSASSLKVSVHNTRSLAYRAITSEVNLTRTQLIAATGYAVDEIRNPSGAKSKFDKAMARAGKHRSKVERLRDGLVKFNQWVVSPEVGTGLVRQAAEIGYLGNMGTLGTADPGNLGLMHDEGTLAESERSMLAKTIGGVTYTGEAMTPGGHFGKSYVKLKPKVGAFGGAWLGYDASSLLTADAAAGPVPAKGFYSTQGIDAFGINWYTVRLMPIGKRPKEAE